MVLDTSFFNNQNYKVRIQGKVEQSRERSGALPNTSVQQLLKREPSAHPRLSWLFGVYGRSTFVGYPFYTNNVFLVK